MNDVYRRKFIDWVDCPYCEEPTDIDDWGDYANVEKQIRLRLNFFKCGKDFIISISVDIYLNDIKK